MGPYSIIKLNNRPFSFIRSKLRCRKPKLTNSIVKVLELLFGIQRTTRKHVSFPRNEFNLNFWKTKFKAGFAGDGFLCEDFDECATDSHACDENAACLNRVGSYECICDDGWAGNGTHCEIPKPEIEPISIREQIMRPFGMWTRMLSITGSSQIKKNRKRPKNSSAIKNLSKIYFLMIFDFWSARLMAMMTDFAASFDRKKWIRVWKWRSHLARRVPAAELRCGEAGNHKRLEKQRKWVFDT